MTTRREFLKTGLVGGLLLNLSACANTSEAERRVILTAISQAVLKGALPANPMNVPLLTRMVDHVEQTIAGLPLPTRTELSQLFGLLSSSWGRCLLAGLWVPWQTATTEDVAAFLESWRFSRFSLLRSAYAGLHDLILGAWYADPESWPAIGYSGPPRLG